MQVEERIRELEHQSSLLCGLPLPSVFYTPLKFLLGPAETPSPTRHQPLRGRGGGAVLSLENLSIAHGPRGAVVGLDLDVARGEWVGVIGPDGAGRGALVSMLSGMADVTQGRASIFGHNILSADLSSLRSTVAVVHSSPWLFAGTVRENLDLEGESQGDWQVWAALEQCHFGDVVRSWQGGLDHRVREGGSGIPKHHRMALCIARALLSCDVRFLYSTLHRVSYF